MAYWVYTGRRRLTERWLGPFVDVPTAQQAGSQHAEALGCPAGTFEWIPILPAITARYSQLRGYAGMSMRWRHPMPFLLADETEPFIASRLARRSA